jgi:dCTP deaminase
MCILSDAEISSFVASGTLIRENYSPDSLTPNGYDLRVEAVSVSGSLPLKRAEIPPMTWFAVTTMEVLQMPEDICAQLWIRSSYARKGVIASFGKVDAGFHGTLTLTAFNASQKRILISSEERFVQIVFERLSTRPLKGYGERSGNYQGQKGLTMEPLNSVKQVRDDI